MLLLLTIALVLVAAITLLIGIIGDTLALIFVSIACSFGAGVTLLLLSRASKARARAGDGSAPEAPTTEQPAAETAPAPVTPIAAPVEAAAPVAAATAPSASLADDPDFPIANYDDLRVAEILPLLDDLDLDELDMVLEREENGKNRSTLIKRLNERMDILEAEEEAAAGPATEVLEPVTAGTPAGDDFPIESYDELRVAEVLPLLDELSDEELEIVYEREDAGAARAAILNRIDEILDEREGIEPGGDAFAPEAAAAEAQISAPARARVAKKATAKKATAKKATAKKAAVKQVTPTKAAAKKATVAKKATAVKKAAVAKKATTVKKAAVASKATTKKAAVAKRATATKKR